MHSTHRAYYSIAGLIAALYLGFVYIVCAAGEENQLDWSFVSKLLLIGGAFFFLAFAAFVITGNSAHHEYINAKQDKESEFLTDEEIAGDEGFIEGFRVGMIMENMHSSRPVPASRPVWNPIIAVMAAAIIGFALGGLIVKRLLGYKDKLNS